MQTTAQSPRRWARVGRRVALGLVLLFPASYLGIALYSAEVLTRARNIPSRVDPKWVGGDAEPWSTTTDDGLTLRGWYYPTASHRRLVVLVHGLWRNWEDMAGIGRDLHARGYDVLLFDLRGHGGSDPARLSLGYRERGDLRAVLAWAQARGFDPDRIGWVGHSMGAATLLMEGVEDREIRAVALDSPYGNLPQLLDSQLAEHSGLPRFFNPAILLAVHHAFGTPTGDLVPIEIARRWGPDRPVLLFHGEADATVPIAQARALAASLGPACRPTFVPGVGHEDVYEHDPKAYIDALDAYFDEVLK